MLIPQHLLSRVIGRMMRSEQLWLKDWLIRWFIRHYQIDLTEAVISDPNAYKNFNQFFTRRLRPEARPIAEDQRVIVAPADGVISEIGNIEQDQLLQVKGQYYSLAQLLSAPTLASQFANGKFATIYLSPRDYHRVHMPFTGQLLSMHYIPGSLFSVNQQSVARIPRLFAQNERLVCVFKTEFGSMIVILVGALLVASIVTSWAGCVLPRPQRHTTWNYAEQGIFFEKGQEMGYFQYGSTVIVLFPATIAEWDAKLMLGCPVNMGQGIGEFLP